MAVSAWYTPQTVPNKPTNGAVAPTVAKAVKPLSMRKVSSSKTFLMVRVRKAWALPASSSRSAPKRA